MAFITAMSRPPPPRFRRQATENMKFGEYLRSQQVEEWRNSYIDYDKLKKMIKQLEDSFVSNSQSTGEKGTLDYSALMGLQHHHVSLTL